VGLALFLSNSCHTITLLKIAFSNEWFAGVPREAVGHHPLLNSYTVNNCEVAVLRHSV
jgi:hypothetical protein